MAAEMQKFKTSREPIKALSRKDAAVAFPALKARGPASDTTVTCKRGMGRGLALAGIHRKACVAGPELCSSDILLKALIAVPRCRCEIKRITRIEGEEPPDKLGLRAMIKLPN